MIILAPAVMGSLSVASLVFMLLVRRYVLPRMRVKESDSEFVGAMVQSVMVFYGLVLALIAVNVWQSYNDVSRIISLEATNFYTLYRDAQGYPEPTRSRLEGELRGYIDQVIHGAFPLMRQGKVPTEGVERMTRFQNVLLSFEPSTDREKLIHAETLACYNRATLARRLRVDAVHTGLPGVMWAVIVIGALISISASLFFRVEDARLHGLLVVLLSALIGLVILLTVALDKPFRGDLGLSPEPYQLVYDQLMKQ